MAQPVAWNSEQQVNTETLNNQGASKTVGLEGGGFVVVWMDYSGSADDSGAGIKAQVYDPFGTPQGGEIAVNTWTNGDQYAPAVTAMAGGGFTVAWVGTGHPDMDTYQGVSAQMFDALGNKVGDEILVSDTTSRGAEEPTIAALDSGGFAIAWMAYDQLASEYAIGIQSFDASGVPDGPVSNITTPSVGVQQQPDIAALGNGRFVVAWSDQTGVGGDTDSAIHYRIFEDHGPAVSDELIANVTTDGTQARPTVAALGDGGFVIAWADHSGAYPGWPSVIGQVFDQNGTPSTGEFIVDAGTNAVGESFDLTSTSSGFLLVEEVWAPSPDADQGIYARDFSWPPSVDPIPQNGDTLVVNGSLPGYQTRVSAGRLADGRIVVTYSDDGTVSTDESGTGVRVRVIDPRAGQIAGTDKGEAIVGSRAGGAIIDDTMDGLGGNDAMFGLDGADIMSGGGDDDMLDGGGGSDVLMGGTGNDELYGGDAADLMHGEAGDDIYYIDNVDDQVFEEDGAGDDRAISSVSFSLAVGGSSGAHVEDLELIGEDDLDATGNAHANHLVGNRGDNHIDGLGGGDTLEGGDGDDEYVVDDAGDKIVEQGGPDGGYDGVFASVSWTLGDNVEQLKLTGNGDIDGTGNALANEIDGNEGANVIDGKEGADWMSGGLGNDTYYVDDAGDTVLEGATGGTDTVWSGIALKLGAGVENLRLLAGATNAAGAGGPVVAAGNELGNAITGNAAANRVVGNAGNDTLRGAAGNDTLIGGIGRDALAGGAGRDSFIFDKALKPANIDKLLDFSAANDTFRLDDAVFRKLGAGWLDAEAFHIGTVAAEADDRIIYNQKNGVLFYDANGDAAGGALRFATVKAGIALTHHDFFVF